MRVLRTFGVAAALLALVGCASSAADVQPVIVGAETTVPETTPPPTTPTTRATTPATTAVPVTAAVRSVYYANCTEAKAAGAAPLYQGDPGYRSQLDRDSDGVACE